MAQLVKNLPAMRETWVQFLGWEDPLENGTAIHSSILAWRILAMDYIVLGHVSQRVGQDCTTFTSQTKQSMKCDFRNASLPI